MFSLSRACVTMNISSLSFITELKIYPPTEIRAARDLTVPTSLEVPHCGVGVNSGRKVGGNTQTIPEANKRMRSSPGQPLVEWIKMVTETYQGDAQMHDQIITLLWL